jgi:hypothetical protein
MKFFVINETKNQKYGLDYGDVIMMIENEKSVIIYMAALRAKQMCQNN